MARPTRPLCADCGQRHATTYGVDVRCTPCQQALEARAHHHRDGVYHARLAAYLARTTGD